VELASPSNHSEVLRFKMRFYITGGARLGPLLMPWQRTVEELSPKPAAGAAVLAQVIIKGQRLEAGLEFAGLRIDLVEIW
jgi:hypothetical protein